ncbi:MFS transporter [Citricoccus sp.]|uniref:MFS transporter n=1 Tax=Citricoccus sp. TaxID=1978372 RepID=UPI0026150E7B|nr:MFS transporter [Citricoccus sp.]HRO30653.1 MFS transporter [Citricoccus sp.]HRO93609.1 MFS transporter [Citricoccus sp.]
MNENAGTDVVPLNPRAREAQRHTVAVLGTAQVFSGLGNGATLSLGSILAVDLSGAEATAGLVNTGMTLGSAVVSIPLAQLALSRGRRVALGAGLAAGLVGQALMVTAVLARAFPVLLLGAFLVGFGAAVNLQARFAVTDLAEPRHRGRDLSLVVWAVTVGAVLGPNMVGPGAVLSGWLGIPAHAGPFLISGAGMLVGWLIILLGLRPDPLLLRRELEGVPEGPDPDASRRPVGPGTGTGGVETVVEPVPVVARTVPGNRWTAGWHAIRRHPSALAALVSVIAAHAVMVGLMSMTPLHLQHQAGVASSELGQHPDTVVLIGFTISLHVAGMYALSPLMGVLADRFGPARIVSAGLATLLAATAFTGFLPGEHWAVVTGLVLLGLGWSATTVAGSTLLVAALAPQERVPAQGFSDAAMSLAAAVGSVLAGLVMGWIDYAGLSALLGAVVLASLAGVVALVRRQPAPSA